MKTLTVLGSTGSIGTNTLDVVRHNRHLYQVYALVAGQNIELLASQILEFRPNVAVVATAERSRPSDRALAAVGSAARPIGRSWLAGDAARGRSPYALPKSIP